MSIQHLCAFLNWVFAFLFLSCKSSLYIMDTSLLPNRICKYVFEFCMLSFHKTFFLRFYYFFSPISNCIETSFGNSLWDMNISDKLRKVILPLLCAYKESPFPKPALCAIVFGKHLFWCLLMYWTLGPTSGGIRWNSFSVS